MATQVEKLVEVLGGDHAVAQQIVAQLDTNPLTQATTLLLQEEKKQVDEKKGDTPPLIVNQCTK